jgi:hypothetical protein
MPEGSNFEVKFGQLADSQIYSKAPSLTQYKVGFQLIDKNEDETKAVGVMVYKIGEQWAYIPVFFMNGRLRGDDLLYLQQQDMFVPVKEGWLSLLKQKQPHDLGNPTKYRPTPGAPSEINIFERYDDDGSLKYASEEDPQSFAESTFDGKVAYLTDHMLDMMKEAPTGDPLSIDKWMPRMGKTAVSSFIKTMKKHPEFANAVLEHYEPDALRKIAAGVDKDEEDDVDGTSDSLKIITDTSDAEFKELKPHEKQILVKDQIFIQDERGNTTDVFKGETTSANWNSPKAPGKYNVLMADGSTKSYCILRMYGPTLTEYEQKSPLVLIDPDDKKIHTTTDTMDILANVDSEYVGKKKPFENISLGKKPTPSNMAGNYKRFILFDELGCAVEVTAEKDGKNISMANSSDDGDIRLHVELTDKPGKMFISGGTLYVPDSARIIEKGYDHIPASAFGSPDTMLRHVMSKNAMEALTVYHDRNSYLFSNTRENTDSMNFKEAMIYATRNLGISAPTAKTILKEAAQDKIPQQHTYIVKYAESYDFSNASSKLAPNSIDTDYHTPKGMPFAANSVETVTNASANGVKEVMDVSIMKSMLNNNTAMDNVDEYTSDLVRGQDRIGRLLFLYYWHADDFIDRYGKEDMKHLESSLKEVFDSLSDLILFVKSKTISSTDVLEDMSGDLSEGIGV